MEAGAAAKASPAYMVAGFLHLLLLVALSFWTIATYVHKEYKPVEVRIAKPQRVIPVTSGTDRSEDAALEALADATKRDLEAVNEADTNDPFQEARGDKSGEVNVFGAGGGGRSGMGRGGRKSKRGGASKASNGSLRTGLEWLARHRSTDGGWGVFAYSHTDPDHVHNPGAVQKKAKKAKKAKKTKRRKRRGRRRRTGATRSPAKAPSQVAQTGAALLAFLFADHDPGKEGPYRGVVEAAEEWLVKRVSRDGRFPNRCTYSHAIGALALSECLTRRRRPELEKAVQRLVRLLIKEQNAPGGWRYMGGNDCDTSVTSWVALALRSAKAAKVSIPDEVFEKARAYMNVVTAETGTTGYVSRGGGSPAMNASGLFLRLMLGEEPTTPRNKLASRIVGRSTLKVQKGTISNFYHLYYASLAMYQVGGKLWLEFNPRLRDGLISTQRKGSHCERGSWQGSGTISDPVLSTAFATLILETYFRYLPQHEGVDHSDPQAIEGLSKGELLLDTAGVALHYARENKSGGEILAAEAAWRRALKHLVTEGAKWELESQARMNLVEIAVLMDDRERILQRVGEYLKALPSGQKADKRLLRLDRLERFGALQARIQAAQGGKDAKARRAVEGEIAAFAKRLEGELPRLKKWGDLRVEAEEMLARLRASQTRLAFGDDPQRAIAEATAQVERTKPSGPLGRPERELLLALLLHAHALFKQSGQEKNAKSLVKGEQAMLRIEQRRMIGRLKPEAAARLQPLLEQARLHRILALLALERHERASSEARSFVRMHPKSAFCAQAEAVERGALTVLARRDGTNEEQRRRLNLLLRRYASRNPELKPKERLALADLLERADNKTLAAAEYEKVIERGRPSEQALAVLRLVRLERIEGRVNHALELLERIGQQDRLDVILERCLLWRAKRDPERALACYLDLLRTLTDKKYKKEWWPIAFEASQAYVESIQIEEAREFLENLRVKDRRFGGDEDLRSRFLALMRKLDTH